MPERLFLFIQLELPWLLGPPDGRYLLRTRGGLTPTQRVGLGTGEAGEPERVIVLGTVGAGRRAELGLGRRRSGPRRARPRPTTPDPTPVDVTRATIIDPVSLSAERQAQAWLADLDAELQTRTAVAALNRLLFAHRIAAADPSVHEVSPTQALVIRAGWGEGEQVAEGLWLHALELPWAPSSRGRRRIGRSAALRPQERLAELLGAREEELLCEELALRARLDLDAERLPHATFELDGALTAALRELGGEDRPDLAPRVAELAALRPGVTPAAPDEAVVRHALERLEAALRARTAVGFTRTT